MVTLGTVLNIASEPLPCAPAAPARNTELWNYIRHHSPFFADLVQQADMVHIFQADTFGGTCFVPFYTSKIFIQSLEPMAAREKVERPYTNLYLPPGCSFEKIPMRRGVLDMSCLEVVRSRAFPNGVVYVVREH